MRLFTICLILVSIAASVAAEDALTSPYREQTSTEIRGLTETEIAELREGRGMGLARAAELNGYPGPQHVLDAAQDGGLHLSPAQVRTVRQLFDRMTREAQRLGNLVLNEERALESEFRAGTISEADLHARVGRIVTLKGELRAVHLRTHLETRPVLSEQQIQHYNQLRGYSGGSPEVQEHPRRH